MLELSNIVLMASNQLLIKSVSFCAKEGDIIGFIGPNGAGKTTTMRIIAGTLEPTSGSVIIDGVDIWKSRLEAQAKLGFLPEGAPLYSEMTPKSYLQFICSARNILGAKQREFIKDAAEKTNIQTVFHKRIETLSKGFKRRVAIAGAIVHRPKLLILDEPTDGLDPNQKSTTYQLLKSISAQCVIIISTHLLEEVASVCNRAIIINNGEILRDFTPSDLANLGEKGGIESGFQKLTEAQKSRDFV